MSSGHDFRCYEAVYAVALKRARAGLAVRRLYYVLIFGILALVFTLPSVLDEEVAFWDNPKALIFQVFMYGFGFFVVRQCGWWINGSHYQGLSREGFADIIVSDMVSSCSQGEFDKMRKLFEGKSLKWKTPAEKLIYNAFFGKLSHWIAVVEFNAFKDETTRLFRSLSPEQLRERQEKIDRGVSAFLIGK